MIKYVIIEEKQKPETRTGEAMNEGLLNGQYKVIAKSVLDGKQRETNLIKYINNEYALTGLQNKPRSRNYRGSKENS